MTIREYLEQQNEKYKSIATKDNELSISRSILLEMPQDIQCTITEFKAFIASCLPQRGYNTEATLESLAACAHDYLLLSIDFNSGYPRVKEDYSAWLNLDTMELAAAKPYDAFSSLDNCVFVDDYRKAGASLSWNDLVRCPEAAGKPQTH